MFAFLPLMGTSKSYFQTRILEYGKGYLDNLIQINYFLAHWLHQKVSSLEFEQDFEKVTSGQFEVPSFEHSIL